MSQDALHITVDRLVEKHESLGYREAELARRLVQVGARTIILILPESLPDCTVDALAAAAGA